MGIVGSKVVRDGTSRALCSGTATSRRRSSLGAVLGSSLLAAVLLVGAPAQASERARVPSERSVSAADEAPQLARRRARQKSSKSRRGKATQKPAEEAPAPGEQAPAAQDAGVDAATRRGPTRVEFDERLMQGQTNKANAIYLFQRRESALRSLVKKREHFQAEIDEALE